jgi:hypothetical protein
VYIHKPARRGMVSAAPPIPDWSRLCRKDHIEVHSAGHGPRSGIIDMIAADRSVLWMIRDDGAGRTMVCCGDDVTVVKVASANAMAGRTHAAA